MSTDVTNTVTDSNRTDESSFGLGAHSSHDADVLASGSPDAGSLTAALGGWTWTSADEPVEDSHGADIAAAYDRSSKRPVKDGTGLHH